MNIGTTTLIHRDAFAYISHPTIAVLPSGEWLAAFNHSRRRIQAMHPPTDPLFRTLICRSRDVGVSWDMPAFAPDFDWYGTECPGLATTSAGTVLLTQFRFGWYPLALAKEKRAQGEKISLLLEGRGWTEEFEDDEWDDAIVTWARAYHGLYLHRSFDDGRLYEQTVRISCEPYRDGYTRTGIRELSDGRLVYIVTEHHPPHNLYTYAFFSSDDGASWDDPVVVCEDRERKFGEPDVVEVSPGELFCVLRESKIAGCLYGCRSSDGGATWSEPYRTEMDGFPGQLVKLSDGRLLCTYGRRKSPFGIRASISEDGGRTWPKESEIVIRDDLPNGDLGYPTTIEYAPGKLYCAYYGQDAEGVTFVMGTYVDL